MGCAKCTETPDCYLPGTLRQGSGKSLMEVGEPPERRTATCNGLPGSIASMPYCISLSPWPRPTGNSQVGWSTTIFQVFMRIIETKARSTWWRLSAFKISWINIYIYIFNGSLRSPTAGEQVCMDLGAAAVLWINGSWAGVWIMDDTGEWRLSLKAATSGRGF